MFLTIIKTYLFIFFKKKLLRVRMGLESNLHKNKNLNSMGLLIGKAG